MMSMTGGSLPAVMGVPSSRGVLAQSTAYQATNPAKSAFITANVQSISQNALLAATEAIQRGEFYLGATAGEITGFTGIKIATPENSQGGILVVGLTITQTQNGQIQIFVPAGWFFGWHQTVGTQMSVPSCVEQGLV